MGEWMTNLDHQGGAMTKTAQMLAMERLSGRDIRELLRDAYAEAGNTALAAAQLGISAGAFSTWLGLLGGEIRSEVVFPTEEVAA
jgi:hypothetical protein